MNKKNPINPTDAELSILKTLWLHGEMKVKEVHEEFAKNAKKKSRLHDSSKIHANNVRERFD